MCDHFNLSTFIDRSKRFNFVWRVFFCIIALPANQNILALKALVMFPNARKIFFAVFTGERHWFV
jgi:hypothetical protein